MTDLQTLDQRVYSVIEEEIQLGRHFVHQLSINLIHHFPEFKEEKRLILDIENGTGGPSFYITSLPETLFYSFLRLSTDEKIGFDWYRGASVMLMKNLNMPIYTGKPISDEHKTEYRMILKVRMNRGDGKFILSKNKESFTFLWFKNEEVGESIEDDGDDDEIVTSGDVLKFIYREYEPDTTKSITAKEFMDRWNTVERRKLDFVDLHKWMTKLRFRSRKIGGLTHYVGLTYKK